MRFFVGQRVGQLKTKWEKSWAGLDRWAGVGQRVGQPLTLIQQAFE